MTGVPYRPDLDPRTRSHGGWRVPVLPCAVTRPNRTAAGMSSALDYARKRGHRLDSFTPSGDVLTLTVRGTLDALAGRACGFHLTRAVCPCCGGKTAKVRLAPRGGAVIKANIQAMKKRRPRLP